MSGALHRRQGRLAWFRRRQGVASGDEHGVGVGAQPSGVVSVVSGAVHFFFIFIKIQ